MQNSDFPAFPCIYGATNGADGLTKKELLTAILAAGLNSKYAGDWSSTMIIVEAETQAEIILGGQE